MCLWLLGRGELCLPSGKRREGGVVLAVGQEEKEGVVFAVRQEEREAGSGIVR